MTRELITDAAIAACRNYVIAGSEVRRLSKSIVAAIDRCGDNGSHLNEAYEFDTDDEGTRHYLSHEDQIEVLSACPHCLAAHNAIQERKLARKRLGIAKRAVSRAGKAALKASV